MRRKDLPENSSPLETNIANVEGIQNPSPLRIAEVEIFLRAGRFGVADIAAVEVGENVEAADDG